MRGSSVEAKTTNLRAHHVACRPNEISSLGRQQKRVPREGVAGVSANGSSFAQGICEKSNCNCLGFSSLDAHCHFPRQLRGGAGRAIIRGPGAAAMLARAAREHKQSPCLERRRRGSRKRDGARGVGDDAWRETSPLVSEMSSPSRRRA